MRVQLAELKRHDELEPSNRPGRVPLAQLNAVPQESLIPEAPGTLKIQLQQLAQGKRRVVMFPKGTDLQKRPKGMKSYTDAQGNTFIYNPQLIDYTAIQKAVESNDLPSILGAVDGGMGAPDKTSIAATGEPPVSVVARDRSGETAQGTVTDQAHVPQAIEQAAKLTPPGGQVRVEDPKDELAHRISQAHGRQELTRGTSDIPITENGEQEAADVGMGFRKRGGLDKIYHGPLQRTRDTALLIGQGKTPLIPVEGLRPWALGSLEGTVEKHSRPIVNRLMKSHSHVAPPGKGPLSDYKGESHTQFVHLVAKALQPILRDSEQNPADKIGVVTHSRDLRVIRALIDGGFPARTSIDKRALDDKVPDPGQVVRLVNENGRWRMEPFEIHGEGRLSPGIYVIRHGETEWNKDSGEADTTERGSQDEPVHEFSSTHVNLPAHTAAQVRRAAARIPDQHLAEDGREDNPHITVKYGLHTEDPEAVRRLLAGERPIRAVLGKTSLFKNDDAHVLKVDVHSPDLHRLNKKIAGRLPHTDTHPDYKPHATIAYLKPDEKISRQYEGKELAGVTGNRVLLDRLTFSGKNGQKMDIPLTGGRPAAGPPRQAPAPKNRSAKPNPAQQIYQLVVAGNFKQALAIAQQAVESGALTDDDVEQIIARAEQSLGKPIGSAAPAKTTPMPPPPPPPGG